LKYLLGSALLWICTFAFASPPDPLPMDEAYQLSASLRDNQTVIVQWKIAPGYYLYKDHIAFQSPDQQAQLGQPLMPPAKDFYNPTVGHYKTYQGNLNIPLPVISAKSSNWVLKVHYQGCSQFGYCYPPTDKILKINTTADTNTIFKPLAIDVPAMQYSLGHCPEGALDRITCLLAHANPLYILLGFLGFGLLVSFTPCVLPMVPILSAIIIGQKKLSTLKSFALSASYVLGIAITYAVVGVVFGELGNNLQTALQNTWVLVLFSLLFVVLALSLFGFYELRLPTRWQNHLHRLTEPSQKSSLISIFVMGVLSTLVLSPCVTPPLVAALSFISTTGNAVLGAAALFTMGLGMGVPLLIIGTLGGKFLPHTGEWMEGIKRLIGILLLAVAISMLSRVITGPVIVGLWALLAFISAYYLDVFEVSQKTIASFIRRLLGLVLFVYAILAGISALMGNSDPLKPWGWHVKNLSPDYPVVQVNTVLDVKRALHQAVVHHKAVMLDFYADWCIACKELDRFTLSNPRVQALLRQMMVLKADVSQNSMEDKNIMKHYHVIAPPTLIFFDEKGHEIKKARIVGVISAKQFERHLKQNGLVSSPIKAPPP